MAAGLTIAPPISALHRGLRGGRPRVADAQTHSARVVETDGELEDAYFTPQFVELIDGGRVGPRLSRRRCFPGEFDVASQALREGQAPEAAAACAGSQRCSTRSGSTTRSAAGAHHRRLPARERHLERRHAGADDRRARARLRRAPDWPSALAPSRGATVPIGYNFTFYHEAEIDHMEAERLNAIESLLADLRRRAGELRGYL